MRRVKFTYETPTWFKPGAVIFATDDADRDAQIADQAGPKATVRILEERAATPDELARYARYKVWLEQWQAAATQGQAGRHIAGPSVRKEEA